MEHDNSIKEGIQKLGQNLTDATLTRCSRMLPVARKTVNTVAKECNLMKRSGKHFVQTMHNDLIKLVKQILRHLAGATSIINYPLDHT